MKNFPFTYNGKEYWYSRSIVCSNYVFCAVHGKKYILAAQRGPNQTLPGKWNVPGGFLDYDEECHAAAIRETLEETGVDINEILKSGGPIELTLFNIDDKPNKGPQHIIFSYKTRIEATKLPELSNSKNESGETSDIKWIGIDEVDKYNWIPGQLENIKLLTKDLSSSAYIK